MLFFKDACTLVLRSFIHSLAPLFFTISCIFICFYNPFYLFNTLISGFMMVAWAAEACFSLLSLGWSVVLVCFWEGFLHCFFAGGNWGGIGGRRFGGIFFVLHVVV